MTERDTPKIVEEITHVRQGPWTVNYLSSDFANLNYELVPAPAGPNSATYLTHITMGLVETASQGYVIDCKLLLNDDIGAEVFGPVQLTARGQSTFSKDFTKPLKITDNKALDLTGTSAGKGGGYYTAAFVFIEGYTAQNPITQDKSW